MRKDFHISELTLYHIARIGLWLEDPYGDGIRLDSIRNPSIWRQAALAYVKNEPFLDSEYWIQTKYEPIVKLDCFTKKGYIKADIARNCHYDGS